MRRDSQRLYELAEGQGGYFSASQARELGFGGDLISYHAKQGNFLRAARGIYRLRRFPASPFEDLIVACLRAGPKAAVSHETALAVYSLSDLMPAQIHLIVPRTKSRRLKGLKLHRHRLGENEVTRRDGVRVTTAIRTLLDVAAAGVSEDQVVKAVHDALQGGLVRRNELLTAARSRGGRARKVIEKAVTMAGTAM
ncbi:MAG: type IV toxin-antitoxin system AbiEi family antitoxin domain-containing protein [Bacillota bacterium]|nr:type IV toxin-antitoxin system AbiEi family antitoxin domain-containing protein [Bacillota bacterium]